MPLPQRTVDGLKFVGLLVIGWYILRHPQQLEIRWVLVFLGITLSVSVSGGILQWYIEERLRTSKDEPRGNDIENSEPGLRTIRQVLTHPIRALVLLPGEDGLFFVPPLLIGINPTTALVCAIAFALAHLGQYRTSQVVGKGIMAFLVVLVVLPHGLLNVIAGHLIQDTTASLLLPLIKKL